MKTIFSLFSIGFGLWAIYEMIYGISGSGETVIIAMLFLVMARQESS